MNLSNTDQIVQLQSVGRVAAKPAAEFIAGDFMAWNFGYSSKVLGVAKETKAFITFDLQSVDIKTGEVIPGKTYTRRLGKTRLVAIANKR